jgi:hypothetical protein
MRRYCAFNASARRAYAAASFAGPPAVTCLTGLLPCMGRLLYLRLLKRLYKNGGFVKVGMALQLGPSRGGRYAGRGSVFFGKTLQAKAAALKHVKEFTQFCCCSSFYSDLVTSSLALIGEQRILNPLFYPVKQCSVDAMLTAIVRARVKNAAVARSKHFSLLAIIKAAAEDRHQRGSAVRHPHRLLA